jgi:HAD superfamily hydrolase (TIGR01549 family)
MHPIDTILFDWDGTLIDTAQPSFIAFRQAFKELGIPLDSGIYERIYSPNWYSMYEELHLPRERWQEADDLWIRYYTSETSQLMPGGQAALNELARREYAIGIVTSGSGARVRQEIKAFGLADLFQVVICSEDVVNKKPHPEGLEIAIERMRKRPELCCYVGDSQHDIEMGRRAKVLTVAIPSRYPSSRQLPGSHPDLWFDTLEQFVAELDSFFMWGGSPEPPGAKRRVVRNR